LTQSGHRPTQSLPAFEVPKGTPSIYSETNSTSCSDFSFPDLPPPELPPPVLEEFSEESEIHSDNEGDSTGPAKPEIAIAPPSSSLPLETEEKLKEEEGEKQKEEGEKPKEEGEKPKEEGEKPKEEKDEEEKPEEGKIGEGADVLEEENKEDIVVEIQNSVPTMSADAVVTEALESAHPVYKKPTKEQLEESMKMEKGVFEKDDDVYKVRVTLMDETTREYQVCTRWKIENLIAVIAEDLHLTQCAGLFDLCDGLRNSGKQISSTNFMFWHKRQNNIYDSGITPQRYDLGPRAVPLVFRMRWFKVPQPLLRDSPEMMHQMYLHTRASLVMEDVNMEEAFGIQLAGLALQAKFGDYIATNVSEGEIIAAEAGVFFCQDILSKTNSPTNLARSTIAYYKRLAGMTKVQAERRYLRLTRPQNYPLTGGTVFKLSSVDGKDRSVTVLQDGISVLRKDSFCFYSYEEFYKVRLIDRGTSIQITLDRPIIAELDADANGNVQVAKIEEEDVDPEDALQKLILSPHEPELLYEAICGYLTLARPLIPPSCPDTRGIDVPEDLPPYFVFQPHPMRKNIIPQPSLCHFFRSQLRERCAESRYPIPDDVESILRTVLRSFDALDPDREVAYAAEDESPSKKEKDGKSTAVSKQRKPVSIDRFAVMDALELSKADIAKEQLIALAETLTITAVHIGQIGIRQNFNITTINFSGIKCKVQDTIAAVKILCESKLPLETLVLRRIGLTEKVAKDMGTALRKSKFLKHLTLDENLLFNNGAETILAIICEHVLTLEEVFLRRTGLSEDFILKFQNIIFARNRPRSISLAGNSFGVQGGRRWADFLSRRPPLYELDLRDCKLGKSSLLIIGALSASNIKKLQIGMNDLNKESVSALADSVASGSTNITGFDISYTKMNSKATRSVLVAAADERATVTSICLNYDAMPKDIAPSFAAFAKTNLSVLKLRGCKMHKACLSALADVVRVSQSLTYLDLSENKFNSTKALSKFGKALHESPALKELYFSDCQMNERRLISFLSAATGMPRLVALHLDGNKLTAKPLSFLAKLINNEASHLEMVSLRLIPASDDVIGDFLRQISSFGGAERLKRIDLRSNKKLTMKTLEMNIRHLPNVLFLSGP